mmetsp:Transcript_63986/g.128399  ORF Transcript_63986/g.128399 Transcript_63986/m.128399 type:complete len:106 (-) Transcript_63986:252-569(-)
MATSPPRRCAGVRAGAARAPTARSAATVNSLSAVMAVSTRKPASTPNYSAAKAFVVVVQDLVSVVPDKGEPGLSQRGEIIFLQQRGYPLETMKLSDFIRALRSFA